MEKILFVATIDQHIRHFHYPFLEWFQNKGFEVHVASQGDEKLSYTDKKFNIPFERSPLKHNNLIAFRKLSNLIETNDYKIIHCHTPMGGAISRLVSLKARKKGTKVIYTAHGFHFYKNAPMKNWLFYYPVEKLLARYTDILITINNEDYELCNSKKFAANKIELVNGVGVDFNKFEMQNHSSKKNLREKYGFENNDFILIYVGELSNRKNQEILIKSAKLLKGKISNFRLLLVGEGDNYERYSELIHELDLNDCVRMMGYRTDVPNLMLLSDIAVSSSKQEGLPVNIMEAMAVGLPLVVSNCRGNSDLVVNDVNGFVVENTPNDFYEGILKLHENDELRERMKNNNLKEVKKYSKENITRVMGDIYTSVLDGLI